MSEEGECVVSCCFSRGFDLLAKQEEQELDFRKDFASGHEQVSEGNREILKWATPKADTDLSSKKRTLPGREREGILPASKYHTSKQWKRLLLTARAESESLSSGNQGSKGCHISSPYANSPLTQPLIYMEVLCSPNFPKTRDYTSFPTPTPVSSKEEFLKVKPLFHFFKCSSWKIS